MGQANCGMEAFPNLFPLVDHHCPHHGVGGGFAHALAGQLQTVAKPMDIAGIIN
jgi:hypothetical protein